MSRATPADFVSAMSMMTTSASSLFAIACATVAPTAPAPPTTVTFRFIDSPGGFAPPDPHRPVARGAPSPRSGGLAPLDSALLDSDLHVCDHRVGELGRLE